MGIFEICWCGVDGGGAVFIVAFVVVLECVDAPVAGAEGADGADDGCGAGAGGNHSYAVADGCGADFAFVGFSAFAGGGVDDEGDFIVFDEVDNVGALTFADFVEAVGFDFVLFEDSMGSTGGIDAEAHGDEGAGPLNDVVLVGIAE